MQQTTATLGLTSVFLLCKRMTDDSVFTGGNPRPDGGYSADNRHSRSYLGIPPVQMDGGRFCIYRRQSEAGRRGLSVRAWQCEANDTIRELHHIEVYQQTDRNVHELHVAQELRLMNREEPLSRFALHQDTTLDQNIEPERLFTSEAFIINRYYPLCLRPEMTKLELAKKAPLIDGFYKAGSLVLVHFNRCTDDRPGQTVRLGELRMHG
jgi:hypothetical protein